MRPGGQWSELAFWMFNLSLVKYTWHLSDFLSFFFHSRKCTFKKDGMKVRERKGRKEKEK
jgi:hypothetical protein